jgi:hypothetical protein
MSMRRSFVAICLVTTGVLAAPAAPKQRAFPNPTAAAEALVVAAETFDLVALNELLGPEGSDLVASGDAVLDRNQAEEFARKAHEKMSVVTDPKNPKKAVMNVGAEEWPLPVPLVQGKEGWRFDAAAGRREILLRRIGHNELDAIEVCRGYVESQLEYASEPRGGSKVTQYAQRIIGSSEKQDGLAWRDADGTWRGPIGDKVARALEAGYAGISAEPYRGYYFKILTGQGPHAPLGEMNFIVGGMMIGGFALAAAPAEYEVTGVKTFIVSHDGVVFEKDLGPKTLERFRDMDRFDPDPSWTPVQE